MSKYKIMKDSIGEIEVPTDKFYGPQTQRSLLNFTIHNEKIPFALISAIATIKKACAIANNKANKMDARIMKAIINVCDMIINHELDDNFALSVWQTGSATQTNMNVNEVIANKANSLDNTLHIHPNDHVNMSQSSNDVIPTAIHLMIGELINKKLLIAIDDLINVFKKVISDKSFDIVKVGRTHLQDATPITLHQEFSAFIDMLENNKQIILESLNYIYQLPIGGTAVGTGLNAPKDFDLNVCNELSKLTSYSYKVMSNKFHGLSSKDYVSNLHNSLKLLAENLYKIANDIRWLSSGPNCGIGEILIPQNEPGSSIMPGKVNPTQCESLMMLCIQVIANNYAISIANTQGNFQLNTFMPLIAYNVNQSINLLSDGMKSFANKCVYGIKPNEKRINHNIEHCLMLATALNSTIGYDKVSEIVKYAHKNGISLKKACLELKYLTSDEFDKIVDPKKMC